MKPGQPILLPVEDKGRLKPMNISEWLDNFLISVETIHTADKWTASLEDALIQEKKQ